MSTAIPNVDQVTDPQHPVHEIVVADAASPEFDRCLHELEQAGVAVPFVYRAASQHGGSRRFIGVRGSDGACQGGLCMQIRTKLRHPHLFAVRLERLGPTLPGGTSAAALDALMDWARSASGLLRLDLEIFSPDPLERERLADTLEGCGFVPQAEAWGYTRTLRLNMNADIDAIFAGFSSSARRNVRKIAKVGWDVRPITDSSLASRMNELMLETMERTGGRHVAEDWAARIAYASVNPSLCRVVGLFDPDTQGPSSLVAFAVGHHNGDHATYDAGASTRRVPQQLPLAYALVWDLIRWAHSTGVSWFDLGGVTDGQGGDPDDPLGGISDFKRYFATDVVTVGQAWCYQPRTLPAIAARLAQRFRR